MLKNRGGTFKKERKKFSGASKIIGVDPEIQQDQKEKIRCQSVAFIVDTSFRCQSVRVDLLQFCPL